MKNKYVYIILFLAISKVIFAQENYVKGYIIKNNNDSIPGLIDFRMDEQNGQSCRFKLSESEPGQIFYPNDILRYKFINEGKYYVSREITIDSVSRRVFLEYLVDGVMDLYFYRPPQTPFGYYFFEDDRGNMTGIRKKPDEIIGPAVRSDKQYIGTLTYLFRDYPTVRKNLTNGSTPMTYERRSMIKVTKDTITKYAAREKNVLFLLTITRKNM